MIAVLFLRLLTPTAIVSTWVCGRWQLYNWWSKIPVLLLLICLLTQSLDSLYYQLESRDDAMRWHKCNSRKLTLFDFPQLHWWWITLLLFYPHCLLSLVYLFPSLDDPTDDDTTCFNDNWNCIRWWHQVVLYLYPNLITTQCRSNLIRQYHLGHNTERGPLSGVLRSEYPETATLRQRSCVRNTHNIDGPSWW